LVTCTPVAKDDPVNDLAKLDSINRENDRVVDSIMQLLGKSDTTKLDENQVLDIHILLQKIIDEKAQALARLDEINKHMDSIEYKVDEYVKKKKASTQLRQKILTDIQKLKEELNEIKPKTLVEIEQRPIPNSLKSLTDLPSGNYRARIDRTHILQFYVNEKGEIFVTPLILDSTTVFNGSPLNPKVLEQIRKVRESLENN